MPPLPADIEAELVRHQKARNRAFLWGGVALLAIAGGAYAIAAATMSYRDRSQIGGLAIFAGVVALPMLLVSLRNPSRAAAIEVLRSRRDDIVWMYVLRQRGNGAASWIVLGTVDAKLHRVHVTIGEEEVLLQRLIPLVPHATVGYSPPLEAKFRASPASFRTS